MFKQKSNSAVTNIGKTDANGKVSKDGLSYGEYEITQTTPEGYTCESGVITVSLNTKNNSLNTVSFTNQKASEEPAKEE